MIVTILGYKYAQGTSKKTNKPYNGFFTCLGYEDSTYTGMKTKENFISAEALQGVIPSVGEKYEIGVDFNGYITSVRPVVEPNYSYGTNKPHDQPANVAADQNKNK